VLKGILELLETRGTLSVLEISRALEVPSSALRPMLDFLVMKKKIVRVELPCSSGCAGGCEDADQLLFFKRLSDSSHR
jgi:predicted ArsR family transcriptional regulator